MARGLNRPTCSLEAVRRARLMIDHRPHPPSNVPASLRAIGYKLGAGGKDPNAPHPATWHEALRRWVCDCSGFTAWALGFDRYQPARFPEEWINTDSMIADAERGGDWFEILAAPDLGCLVVYDAGRKVGHVGLVVDPLPAEWDPEHPSWDLVRVVHCSSSNARNHGGAIQETSAALFRGRDARLLRYLHAAPF
jgi:hypothetical protein